MNIDSIRLKNFRNYSDLSLTIPDGVIVFYGPNGQGKTNLMEAIHFLMRGESFRPHTSSSLLRHVDNSVANVAILEGRLLQKNLRHEVKMTFANGRKQVLWNNNRSTTATLARQFPVVMFSPESLSAIKEGPDLRRQLLDDVVLTHSSASVKILKDFKRALKTRNRILKDAQQEKLPLVEAKRLLESLDPSYLPLAVELTVARLQALKDLQDDFKRAARAVLQLSNVDISVDYLISSQNVQDWTRSDLLSAMHKRSLELRQSELLSGASLVGPHKHDIRILFSGKDSRFFCSQGQQRALILSFKMAQILYHYRSYQVYPFLLLDDVLSELDPIRRSNLVGFLRDIPAQIFLTTTDLSFSMDFGDRRLSVFGVEKGNVELQT
ncbi:MAG: DNA replication and repair protein RecF [Bdellovibrionales bacterium]|nr:DNA replication and repair protein RecF [Bdellovibrionales bacterium]